MAVFEVFGVGGCRGARRRGDGLSERSDADPCVKGSSV
jgi:hypothetical protein